MTAQPTAQEYTKTSPAMKPVGPSFGNLSAKIAVDPKTTSLMVSATKA